MTLGRIHLHGPQAWPDHVLDADLGGPVLGAAIAIRRTAVGFEIVRSAFGRALWLNVYLVWWCFELYLEADGSFEPPDPEWD